MCNPMGAAANRIVEIPPASTTANTKSGNSCAPPFLRYLRIPQSKNQNSKIKKTRLGFDVAASGQGDLAAIYVDEARGNELWLRGLFTCRTEDWHFLKTVLFYFLQRLPSVQAAGDESGLGRQICWEAAKQFGSRFLKVNFASKKHDLGFALMNQLAVAEKRFPKSEADIAADYFALRKAHNGSKWSFSEGRNTLNAASHCDRLGRRAGQLCPHRTALQHRRGRRLRQLLVRWTRVSSL